jgi:uncharacterized protein YceH (UPF0502 family)
VLTLAPEEVRVLGCLVEKAATVPDSYPLTLNALRQACNQSTSRDPVVAYDQSTIEQALDSLKAQGLVRFVHPSHGERTTRFRHVADERLGLDGDAVAVLAVLALRGPQTAAELRGRAERLHPFTTVGEVESVLAGLAARPEPLVLELARQPGQRDRRWVHLLSGPVDVDALAAEAAAVTPSTARSGGGAAADRIAALERQVVDLSGRLARLEAELGVAAAPSSDDWS